MSNNNNIDTDKTNSKKDETEFVDVEPIKEEISVETESTEEEITAEESEKSKTDSNKILLAKKVSNQDKKSFFLTSFLGILIILCSIAFIFVMSTSTLIFSSVEVKLEKQLQDNTIVVQRYIDKVIHDIDMYEVIKNENHIIQLQSDLSSMTTLLEQSTRIQDTLVIDRNSNERPEKLLDSIKLHKFYLEESLKGKMTFVPADIFSFRQQLSVIAQSLSDSPTVSYDQFIYNTNRAFDSIYLDWNKNYAK